MLRFWLVSMLRLLLAVALILGGVDLAARLMPGSVVAYNDFADGGGRLRAIFVMDANRPGLGAREWTRHVPQPFFYHQPNLSLNGQQLVFFSRATGTPAIYGLDVKAVTDGDAARILTTGDGDNLNVNPVWSPDGRQVAYVSARGAGLDIFITDAARNVERVIAGSEVSETRPAWSPDGRYLAYQAWMPESVELYIVETLSGVRYRLTNNRAVDANPAWSPDGRYLAYESNAWSRGSADIAVIDIETGETHRLTVSDASGKSRYTQPVWLANGRQVAFIALIDGRSSIAVADIGNFGTDNPSAMRLLTLTRTDTLWALWLGW